MLRRTGEMLGVVSTGFQKYHLNGWPMCIGVEDKNEMLKLKLTTEINLILVRYLLEKK